MIKRETLDLVERKEHSGQKDLVLVLERQRKTIDDGAEDFEEFGYTIVSFSLVNELEKDVVDRAPYKRTQVQKFAVNPVKGCFEEIPLSWIFRVEEFEKVEHKWLIDKAFSEVGVKVGTFDKTKEKLVDDLEMRPSEFENRLVFLGIKSIPCRVYGRGYGAKEVGSKLEPMSKET